MWKRRPTGTAVEFMDNTLAFLTIAYKCACIICIRQCLLRERWEVFRLAAWVTPLCWFYPARERTESQKIFCEIYLFTSSWLAQNNPLWRHCHESPCTLAACAWSKCIKFLGGEWWWKGHWWTTKNPWDPAYSLASTHATVPWQSSRCVWAGKLWWCPASHQYQPWVWWWWRSLQWLRYYMNLVSLWSLPMKVDRGWIWGCCFG